MSSVYSVRVHLMHVLFPAPGIPNKQILSGSDHSLSFPRFFCDFPLFASSFSIDFLSLSSWRALGDMK